MIRPSLDIAARVASSGVSVLLFGETGTGKEGVASLVHERSCRSGRPFVAINASAIPAALVEAELFGSTRGAFTGAVSDRPGLFQAADRGTLFLDEIGDMPVEAQVKLLRVLEYGEVKRVGASSTSHVDVRIIAATNTDLPQIVRSGSFRADLFYRLAGVSIALPPLRERGGDILLLAHHFASRVAGREIILPDEVLRALEMYDWPGNVRQLKNSIEAAQALTGNAGITLEAIRSTLGQFDPRRECRPAYDSLAEAERKHILHVVDGLSGNVSRAADILGVHRNTLQAKLRRYRCKS